MRLRTRPCPDSARSEFWICAIQGVDGDRNASRERPSEPGCGAVEKESKAADRPPSGPTPLVKRRWSVPGGRDHPGMADVWLPAGRTLQRIRDVSGDRDAVAGPPHSVGVQRRRRKQGVVPQMIFDALGMRSTVAGTWPLSGEVEVVQAGESQHGVVNAVACETRADRTMIRPAADFEMPKSDRLCGGCLAAVGFSLPDRPTAHRGGQGPLGGVESVRPRRLLPVERGW